MKRFLKSRGHGAVKTKGAKIVSRKALIEDMQRVLRTFPTAQPDRDFYRVHGKYSDAAVKVHFSRFKDCAAAAVPEMTPDEAFKLAVRSLDKAIALVKKSGAFGFAVAGRIGNACSI